MMKIDFDALDEVTLETIRHEARELACKHLMSSELLNFWNDLSNAASDAQRWRTVAESLEGGIPDNEID